jgi:hypothetical protein
MVAVWGSNELFLTDTTTLLPLTLVPTTETASAAKAGALSVIIKIPNVSVITVEIRERFIVLRI